MYTHEEWGLDWDYVLDDTTTRVKRKCVNRSDDNHELEKALASLDIDINDFDRIGKYDSPIIDDVIDDIFEYPNNYPHLWEMFWIALNNNHDRQQRSKQAR